MSLRRPEVLGWDIDVEVDTSDPSGAAFEWVFTRSPNQPMPIIPNDQAYADFIESEGLDYRFDYDTYELELNNIDRYVAAVEDSRQLQLLFLGEWRSATAEDRDSIEEQLLTMPILYHFFDDVILDVGSSDSVDSEYLLTDGRVLAATDSFNIEINDMGCVFYEWRQDVDTVELSDAEQAEMIEIVAGVFGFEPSQVDIDDIDIGFSVTGIIDPRTGEVLEVMSADRFLVREVFGYDTFAQVKFQPYET